MRLALVRAAPSHVAALAMLRLRRLWRTRVILLALAIGVLPLCVGTPGSVRGALAVLTSALLSATLVAAAGAVADDLESGSALLLALHGVTPLETILGDVAASLAVVGLVALGAIPLAAREISGVPPMALVGAGAWMATLVVAWAALLALLGGVLPGKGNSLSMIVPVGVFVLPAAALPLDWAPGWLAAAARIAWTLLPLQAHATAMYDALLANSPPPPAAPFVLVLSPVLYLAAGVCLLARLEPARRFTQ